MLNDLNLSLEECLAVLELFVQSNKLSHTEICDTLALVRERGGKHTKVQLQHPSPLRDDHKSKKRQKQLHGSKRNESLLQSRYRHVAIRISYDGSTYSGFAENCGSTTDNSVEKQVFAALTKTCLIASRSSCNYSRCGRTDRGVSAFGQVIALLIRSRIPKVDGKGREIPEEGLPKNSFEPISVMQKKVEKKNNQKEGSQNDEIHNSENQSSRNFGEEFGQELTLHEFDYCRILNGVLPDNIRTIGWTPVFDQFSARFSAMDRTYRYFFVRKNYNLSAMQQALDKLIGTHDFRNLCKMDTEAVSNFQRCIKYAKLVVIGDHGDTSKMGDAASTLSNGYRQMCYFEICGQAFLWHMIRCIVAVCFMVGAGHEEPSVVDDLLDVNKCPAKPSYAMASDLPLVLHSCSYQNVTFGHSSVTLWELTNTLERRWEEAAIAAERIRNAIESLQQETYVQIDEFCSFLNDILGSKQLQKQGNNNGISNETILETIRKLQERQILIGTKQDDIVLQRFLSRSQNASNIVTDTTITTTSANEKSIISWRCALAAIYDLGFPLQTSYGPINGSNVSGRKPLFFHKHVKLMKRSTGTTYEEKILSMKGKKRDRFESNMMKKQQPADDQEFYERMTKYGGSGV